MVIYLITNLINDKQYVGQTTLAVEERWKRHCQPGPGPISMPIVKAIQKYGKHNFKIEVLQECNSLEEMNSRERWWAETLHTFSPTGYNLKAGGGRGSTSQLVRDKIGRSNKGKRRSPEQRMRVAASHRGKGIPAKSLAAFQAQHPKKGTGPGPLAKQNAADRLTYRLRFAGVEYSITNLKQFCRERGFSYSQFIKLADKRLSLYRGYEILSVAQTRFLRPP